MRIIHLIGGRCSGESANGVDRSLLSFAKHQAVLGQEVKVIGVSRKPPYPADGIEMVSALPSWSPFVASAELKAEILNFKPDILQVHGAYVPANIAASRFARSQGIPYVVTPHGNYSAQLLRRKPCFKLPYRFLLERPMAQRALFVHAIADQDDIRRYGVTAPIVVAPNGVDLPVEDVSRSKDAFLANMGVPSNRTTFLFLGRLDIKQKGLDILLGGFAKAWSNNDNFHLILVGPDWEGSLKRLKKMVKDLGIGNGVTFTGGIYGEDKAKMLRVVDYFVHPSRWEAGIPFSVLEALAHGKPCLVTAEVDRLEHLAGREIGVVVEKAEDSVADGICILGRMSVEERERQGLEARRLVRDEFSWKASAKKLLQGYRSHLAAREVG